MAEETAPVRVRTRQIGHISREVTKKHMGQVAETMTESNAIPAESIKNPAYVSVKGEITRNMGDYNSLKVGVSISMPTRPDMKHIEEMYKLLSDKVDAMVDEELKMATGQQEGATDRI